MVRIKDRFGNLSDGHESSLPKSAKAAMEAADTRLSGRGLEGADLAGLDLTGVDLTGVDLTGALIDERWREHIARFNTTGEPVFTPAAQTQKGPADDHDV